MKVLIYSSNPSANKQTPKHNKKWKISIFFISITPRPWSVTMIVKIKQTHPNKLYLLIRPLNSINNDVINMKMIEIAAQKSRTVICKISIQCSKVEMIEMTRNIQQRFCHSVRWVNAAANIGKPKHEILATTNFVNWLVYFSMALLKCNSLNELQQIFLS